MFLRADRGWRDRLGCLGFFQAEDGIRDVVRSRGLGDVYKRQAPMREPARQDVGHDVQPADEIELLEDHPGAGADLSLIHI